MAEQAIYYVTWRNADGRNYHTAFDAAQFDYDEEADCGCPLDGCCTCPPARTLMTMPEALDVMAEYTAKHEQRKDSAFWEYGFFQLEIGTDETAANALHKQEN